MLLPPAGRGRVCTARSTESSRPWGSLLSRQAVRTTAAPPCALRVAGLTSRKPTALFGVGRQRPAHVGTCLRPRGQSAGPAPGCGVRALDPSVAAAGHGIHWAARKGPRGTPSLQPFRANLPPLRARPPLLHSRPPEQGLVPGVAPSPRLCCAREAEALLLWERTRAPRPSPAQRPRQHEDSRERDPRHDYWESPPTCHLLEVWELRRENNFL